MQDPSPVREFTAWLIRRGLPQRQNCWLTKCDDGLMMDSGLSCSSCECVIGDRRGLRHVVRADVSARNLPMAEQKRVFEQELRKCAQARAVEEAERQERAAAESVERAEAVQAQREREARAKAAWRQQLCADCGVPQTTGLCAACTRERTTAGFVQEMVWIELALRSTEEAIDIAAEPELTTEAWNYLERCSGDTSALVPMLRAERLYRAARAALDFQRRRAITAYGRTAEAVSEGEYVRRWALPRTSRERAEELALNAQERSARYLMDMRVHEVRRALAARDSKHADQHEQRSWEARLADFDDESRKQAQLELIRS